MGAGPKASRTWSSFLWTRGTSSMFLVQRVLNDLQRTRLSTPRKIWLLTHPPPSLEQVVSLSETSYARRSSLLTGKEGEGVREELNIRR